MHRGADVEIDDPQLVLQRGALLAVGEAAAGADACVERDRVDRPPGRLDPVIQRVDASIGGQVDLEMLDTCVSRPQLGSGCRDRVVLGGDQQIEAVGRELACQLAADAARGTGHDCESS
jgi:hypothetical protein